MLNEQVCAAGDQQLQRLLTRIRWDVQDQSDVDLINNTCFRENRRIPWENGITVVTPLNRNRWNLNVEATLSFQRHHRAPLRIFISEHKWKNGQPTEEEAVMILSHGTIAAYRYQPCSCSHLACPSWSPKTLTWALSSSTVAVIRLWMLSSTRSTQATTYPPTSSFTSALQLQ